jgi:hypothetical protein
MLLHSTPMDHPMYRIRIVDASDDDIANILADLHQSTFFDAAPLPQFELGAWWLAYHGDEPVASPVSCRQRTFEMAVTSPGSVVAAAPGT